MFRPPLRAPLSCLGLFALTAGAYAQESASAYGIADMYLESVRGSGRVGRLPVGRAVGFAAGLQGPRAAGRRAECRLHAGNRPEPRRRQLRTDALFGRQSFVGFGFEPVGRVTLGRQYTGFWHITDEFSVFSNRPAGRAARWSAASAATSRFAAPPTPAPAAADRSPEQLVGYESPVWRGLRFGVQGGLGEVDQQHRRQPRATTPMRATRRGRSTSPPPWWTTAAAS